MRCALVQPTRPMIKRLKKLSKVFNVLYWILMLVLLIVAGLAALSAFGLPKSFRLFVVQSGSMEPTIKTGSLVIVQPQSQYKKNDVITFKIQPEADIKNPNLLITHRIFDIKDVGGQTFFITKGDANNAPDMEERPIGNVLGKVVFSIPYLGYPVGFAKTQTGFILLIVIPATIIIYSEAITIKNETAKLLAKRRKKKLSLEEKVEVEIGEEEIKAERWYKELWRKIIK
jgi:signal peptidase